MFGRLSDPTSNHQYPEANIISQIIDLLIIICYNAEKYPVLMVVEDTGIKEIQTILDEIGMLAFIENERSLIGNSALRSRADVFILRGKDFSLATQHIAQKEKGFVDLYYAVTRMEYGVSVHELSRIYQNLHRNCTLTTSKVRIAARDRGISTEINWLMGLSKTSHKTREFMEQQIKEIR